MYTATKIVVLTRNRPAILNRCIGFALEHCGELRDAVWIVLDDSTDAEVDQNLWIVQRWFKAGLKIAHITPTKLNASMRSASSYVSFAAMSSILSKSSASDIAGLRNSGLLFSMALGSGVCFFVDDDMLVGGRKGSFANALLSSHQPSANCIVGGAFHGIVDANHLERLVQSLARSGQPPWGVGGKQVRRGSGWYSKKNPIWVENAGQKPLTSKPFTSAAYVSGGLMAFSLDTDHLLPFPAGYNEDWNWCVLQSALQGTRICRAGPPSFHAPPAMGEPSPDSHLWQLCGDIIQGSLLAATQSEDKPQNFAGMRDLMHHAAAGQADHHGFRLLSETKNVLDKFLATAEEEEDKAWAHSYLKLVEELRLAIEKTDLAKLIDSWFFPLLERFELWDEAISRPALVNALRELCNETRAYQVTA